MSEKSEEVSLLGGPAELRGVIRPVGHADADAVMAIAAESGLFAADELDDVRATLEAHLAGSLGPDHRWVIHDDARPSGVAYFAPEPLTQGVWNLYMLAVSPDRQGSGLGASLVGHVEKTAAAAGARIVLIETSGLPTFERTRSFYAGCGYAQEARIRDYYAPGDDKIVFWKSLAE
ncbi:MAG: GNAT family N-acetyltransferase [Myxococcota bacterium]|nr:GNAT family N-acetyltransferase [Myxococcota bacterium]